MVLNYKFELLIQKTFQTELPWDLLLLSEYTGIRIIEIKLTKISYIGTSLEIRFIQDFVLFKVRLARFSQC